MVCRPKSVHSKVGDLIGRPYIAPFCIRIIFFEPLPCMSKKVR